MGKTSKEKVMAKLAQSVSVPEGPKNSGYISLRWEKKIIDGKEQTFLSINEDRPVEIGKNPMSKEYTDIEEFKKVVASKIDKFIEKAE
jgi:hypothetical protein